MVVVISDTLLALIHNYGFIDPTTGEAYDMATVSPLQKLKFKKLRMQWYEVIVT